MLIGEAASGAMLRQSQATRRVLSCRRGSVSGSGRGVSPGANGGRGLRVDEACLSGSSALLVAMPVGFEHAGMHAAQHFKLIKVVEDDVLIDRAR